MGQTSVQVLIDEPFLAEAIIRAVNLDFKEARAVRIFEAGETGEGAVVLAVPSSCSPADAEEIRRCGGRLLLLAPALYRREREQYEAAGATVALMDSGNLVAQVRNALGDLANARPVRG